GISTGNCTPELDGCCYNVSVVEFRGAVPCGNTGISGENGGLDLIRAPDFSETLSRRARTSGGTAYPAVPRYQPRDIAKFPSCATTLR
ncbi:MAG TPA: hypothetical protein VK620_31775, partial [Bradyrhizobium sp.]|nr:hypothetical protein [Bradyrhizobium sp.]